MIAPETRRPEPHAPAAALAPVRCGLDRHLGPFEAVSELGGFLGADWLQCRCCGSPLTLGTAARSRHAA